jgi:GLPGLI family protein
MKGLKWLSLLLLLVTASGINAQKKITDGTIVYDIVIETNSEEPKKVDAFSGAVTNVYLNGDKSRTDMVSSLGIESTIYDAITGKAVILKEYSGQKLMITLSKENWVEKNEAYKGIVFETGTETKVIAGHTCKKAIAKLKDGKSFEVFYAIDLVAGNNEYNPAFKNLPGLAMEYEIKRGKTSFKYTVSKISFEAVNASKFDFPKSGYRVMTYEENQLIKKADNK